MHGCSTAGATPVAGVEKLMVFFCDNRWRLSRVITIVLGFVTLSADVNSSVIINLIIEGADCVWCIWCDLVEMCRYDARVIVY